MVCVILRRHVHSCAEFPNIYILLKYIYGLYAAGDWITVELNGSRILHLRRGCQRSKMLSGRLCQEEVQLFQDL